MSHIDVAGAGARERLGLREIAAGFARERAAGTAWSRRETALAVGALAVVFVLAMAAWWVSGAVVPWDSKNQFYPTFRFLGESLSRGEIPLWNPYHLGGHPTIADPQSLIFTPTMALFALLAPRVSRASMTLFDAVVFAHLFAGGLGIMALCRRRLWRPEAAVLAALIFMLGGSVASRLQHTGMIISLAWLPFAIWSLEAALDRASWRIAVLFGAAAGLMALGRDQVAFLSCGALLWVAASKAMAAPRPGAWLASRLPALCVAGATGLAVLIVPSLLTMQFLGDSNRPAISFGVAAAGSLAPINFVTMLVPNIFGSLNWTYDYWGPGYETMVEPDWTDRAINYLFIGSGPALLLLWHGLAGGRLLGRSLRPFLTIGVAALVYALGRSTPLFALAFDFFPGVDLYRRPADATFLVVVAMAMGSGCLAHRYVLEGLPRPSRIAPRWLALALPLAVIVATATLVGSALAFSSRGGHLAASLREAAVASAIFAGLAACLFVGDRLKRRALAMAAVVAFTGGELVMRNAASSLNAEPASSYIFNTMPPAQQAGLAVLRKAIAAENEAGVYPRVEILGLSGGWQDASIVYQLQNTLGYNPLRIADYARAVGPGENAADANERHYPDTFRGYRCPLAQLLGLEYLVLDRPLARMPRHMPRPTATPIFTGENMYVYRIAGAAPRAYFASAVRPVDTEASLDEHVVPEFDHAREALIDEADVPRLAHAYPDRAAQDGESRVKIAAYHDSRVVIEVDAERPGIVVLHDLFFPGWVATVDGEPRPLLRANLLFRGVETPPGHHVVSFAYQPFSAANLVAAARTALRLN